MYCFCKYKKKKWLKLSGQTLLSVKRKRKSQNKEEAPSSIPHTPNLHHHHPHSGTQGWGKQHGNWEWRQDYREQEGSSERSLSPHRGCAGSAQEQCCLYKSWALAARVASATQNAIWHSFHFLSSFQYHFFVATWWIVSFWEPKTNTGMLHIHNQREWFPSNQSPGWPGATFSCRNESLTCGSCALHWDQDQDCSFQEGAKIPSVTSCPVGFSDKVKHKPAMHGTCVHMDGFTPFHTHTHHKPLCLQKLTQTNPGIALYLIGLWWGSQV